MNEANNKTIPAVVIGIVVLVLIVLGLVVWNRVSTNEPKVIEDVAGEIVEDITLGQNAVLVTHSFADGVHTYVGSLQVPNPCYTLTHEVEVSTEKPIKATVHFVIHPPAVDQVCTQVISDIPFTVQFEAPESSAQADATLNGRPFFIIIGGKE